LRKSLTPAFHFMLALLVAALFVTAQGEPPASEAEELALAMSMHRGMHEAYAPDFTLRMVGGGEFSLADNIGKKVIVLNFFATWCGPCKAEMPELSAYYDKHKEEPFVIIGIDAGQKESKVKKFMDKHGVTFPVGIDEDEEIVDLYGVRSFPATVLIGADGTVKVFEVGPIKSAAASFDDALRESLELIKSGKAIDKKTYLEKLARQS
jgi:peroxiredoxin